jgi:chromate transporter
MSEDNIYLTLLIILAPLSIAAIGGATGIYAPLQYQTVELRHWVTPREFIDLFAIARLTPGPGSMLATLLGWRVAGFGGALVATLALYLPSSFACYGAAKAWNKHRGKPWHKAMEKGLSPIAAGLILSGVVSLLQLGQTGPLSWATVVVVAGLLTWRRKLHPLMLIGCGAALFFSIHLAGF